LVLVDVQSPAVYNDLSIPVKLLIGQGLSVNQSTRKLQMPLREPINVLWWRGGSRTTANQQRTSFAVTRSYDNLIRGPREKFEPEGDFLYVCKVDVLGHAYPSMLLSNVTTFVIS
jgi:hypothetical protein